jgi:hypothetical protein
MKKRIYFAILCLAMAFAINACSDTCKSCQKVKYDSDGNEIDRETAQEYCGLELIGIEAEPDITVLGITTKWECY